MGRFLILVTILLGVFGAIQSVKGPACELPPELKKIGMECMNSGAKGKEEILQCVWTKLGVIDDNNNFLLAKAVVIGSKIKVPDEEKLAKLAEASIECYEKFGKGQGDKAVYCMMDAVKELCK